MACWACGKGSEVGLLSWARSGIAEEGDDVVSK